ncbi:Abi family protein [Orrella sp. 11846]|uniref:Abi family protein n=1 Tax=Orrella sp. 11846 TaxID=3409913 RepID=UPI003B5A79EE
MLRQFKINMAGSQARVQALSHARLSNYRSFFDTVDDSQALGFHQWNDDLSAVFFRTISLLEITLRNQFHRALSSRYGIIGRHGSKDWYAHVALNSHSRSKITDITHYRRGKQILPRVPAPSPDDVVSKLTFGFWSHLLELQTDVHQEPVNWGSILVDVLPGHRQQQATYWAKSKHRDALFARLDLCNKLRNRIAHHEPIWKLGPLMSENRPRHGVPQLVQAPAPSTPTEALLRLRLLYDRVIELLTWLSPDIAAQHSVSEMHLRCLYLLQNKAMNAYQQALSPAEIDLANLYSLRTLRKTLRYATRHQQPLLIKDGHRLIGHLNCAVD